jgi:hypothetical protein
MEGIPNVIYPKLSTYSKGITRHNGTGDHEPSELDQTVELLNHCKQGGCAGFDKPFRYQEAINHLDRIGRFPKEMQ